ncbi:hypothetical protein ACAW74_25660 [Fibrella sp. WM1]|uniref:hypothetical protein n=1 Tax=Fibrella musci TaxID=3242485 RepID=UPI00351FF0A2
MTSSYTVQEGQSLANIAVEVYGDVAGVFWLLADNRDLKHLSDRLFAGQVLTLRADVLNTRARTYLADFAPFATIEDIDKPVGIGYWRIGEFPIS